MAALPATSGRRCKYGLWIGLGVLIARTTGGKYLLTIYSLSLANIKLYKLAPNLRQTDVSYAVVCFVKLPRRSSARCYISMRETRRKDTGISDRASSYLTRIFDTRFTITPDERARDVL